MRSSEEKINNKIDLKEKNYGRENHRTYGIDRINGLSDQTFKLTCKAQRSSRNIPRETETLRLAKKAGCKTMNGLGMMLFQGDAAFHLWTGKHMPIDHMKEVLDIKYD